MRKEIVISVSDTMGATPVAKLVQIANSFNSSIYLTKEGIKVNAKSIMGMMNLVFTNGTKIIIDVSGDDEKEAMNGIEEFLMSLGD